MPFMLAAGGGLSALGSALLGGATAAASAGAGLLSKKGDRKHEEKMATVDRTNAAAGGNQDFADQMMGQNGPNLTLSGANRPVIFNKAKRFGNTF
jgi:hypothetical protein